VAKRSHVSFSVPGEPVAKGRPRFARVGQNVRTFTPQKSARFEDRVRLCAINAGVEAIEGPVSLAVIARWPSRKPDLKKGTRPGEWKSTRPDLDNVLKAVLDALNGVAYLDDGQVVTVLVQKQRAAQGCIAETEIVVGPAEGEPK